MLRWIGSWISNNRGAVAVEFALTLPFLSLLMVGTYEFGSYLYDADVLEKSLRAGAMLAARYSTLDADAEADVDNIIKYGLVNPGAGDSYLLPGWAKGNASITIDEISKTTSYNGTDVDIVVYRITAQVPYVPFMEGFMSRFGTLMLEASHDQRRIGGV